MIAEDTINRVEIEMNTRVKPTEYRKDLYLFIPKEILCILNNIHENQIIESRERIVGIEFGKENK
jgi:hypothetical protein